MNFNVLQYAKNLVPYVPGKPIEETKRELGIHEVIKLASNENPWGPSPKALLAMKNNLTDLHRYPDGNVYALRKKLALKLGVNIDQIILGNGSTELIELLARIFTGPGDKILSFQYSFIAYRLAAECVLADYLEAPVRPDFSLDLELLATMALTEKRVKLIFLPNPNNPTGTYFDRKELVKFLERMQGQNIPVILDEAYFEYVGAEDYPDGIQFLKEYPFLAVLRTFSKAYGLSGLRCGYLVADTELVKYLGNLRNPFSVNSMAQAGAMAALDDEEFVQNCVVRNREGYEQLAKEFQKLKIPFIPSVGNFILIKLQKPQEVFHQSMLRKGVILRPVANYGLPHYSRISIGTPRENEILCQALRDLY